MKQDIHDVERQRVQPPGGSLQTKDRSSQGAVVRCACGPDFTRSRRGRVIYQEVVVPDKIGALNRLVDKQDGNNEE